MKDSRLFFDGKEKQDDKKEFQPLAQRIRPNSLEDVVGQRHLLEPGCVLYESIINDRPLSAIFWGPPGTGKTTLATLIASTTRARFLSLSAVTAGVKDLKEIIDEAGQNLVHLNQRSVVFIDEIHRFNKAQQDVLLPALESGTISLIGATTENPYFEINGPLLSRTRIFRFEPLGTEDICTILTRAVKDTALGLGQKDITIEDGVIDFISDIANGDGRTALNILELAVSTAISLNALPLTVTMEMAIDSAQNRHLPYDKNGDRHYDIISAFIKSLRGSDPDAAIYWLVRMIQAGEDPRFIARRMVIFASEDIGNATPYALTVAIGAASAVDFVGLPEAEINLAHAALYLATAAKSNSVIKALELAKSDVKNKPSLEVPLHLRATGYRGAKELGHGVGYIYTHSDPEAKQKFLPDDAGDPHYYIPSQSGYEAQITKRFGQDNDHNSSHK